MTSTQTLRERKKLRTREELRSAAVSLTAAMGLDAVTVDDIVAVAQVSPRTFFNYFQSKEDAVVGWSPAQVQALIDSVADAPPDRSAFEALTSALTDMFTDLEPDREELLERLRVIAADPRLIAHQASRWSDMERSLTEALAGRAAPGASRKRADEAALTVATVLAACRVAIMAWARDGGHASLVTYKTRFLALLADGFGSHPRRSG